MAQVGLAITTSEHKARLAASSSERARASAWPPRRAHQRRPWPPHSFFFLSFIYFF
jgi:hypothetical protein